MERVPNIIITRVVIGASLAAMATAAIPARADLTGQQIINRCRQAYAALKSYQGTTILSSSRGAATQHVDFERPGKTRVEDTREELILGSSRRKTAASLELVTSSPVSSDDQFRTIGTNYLDLSYRSVTTTYVSDAGHSWVTVNGEELRLLSTAETNKPGPPLKSQPGGTGEISIPGLLIGSLRFEDRIQGRLSLDVWDDPFTNVACDTVTHENVHGRAVYKVVATRRLSKEGVRGYMVYWIDQETFLLAMYSEPGVLETYSNILLNQPIPDATFAPISAQAPHPSTKPPIVPKPNVQLIDAESAVVNAGGRFYRH